MFENMFILFVFPITPSGTQVKENVTRGRFLISQLIGAQLRDSRRLLVLLNELNYIPFVNANIFLASILSFLLTKRFKEKFPLF